MHYSALERGALAITINVPGKYQGKGSFDHLTEVSRLSVTRVFWKPLRNIRWS